MGQEYTQLIPIVFMYTQVFSKVARNRFPQMPMKSTFAQHPYTWRPRFSQQILQFSLQRRHGNTNLIIDDLLRKGQHETQHLNKRIMVSYGIKAPFDKAKRISSESWGTIRTHSVHVSYIYIDN